MGDCSYWLKVGSWETGFRVMRFPVKRQKRLEGLKCPRCSILPFIIVAGAEYTRESITSAEYL